MKNAWRSLKQPALQTYSTIIVLVFRRGPLKPLVQENHEVYCLSDVSINGETICAWFVSYLTLSSVETSSLMVAYK